jgi:hypothetical protein
LDPNAALAHNLRSLNRSAGKKDEAFATMIKPCELERRDAVVANTRTELARRTSQMTRHWLSALSGIDTAEMAPAELRRTISEDKSGRSRLSPKCRSVISVGLPS